MSDSEIFDEKVKCSVYLEKLRDNALISQYENDSYYKVFYSKSLNSCLSEEQSIYPAHGKIPEEEILTINNILTGENIWTSQVYSPAIKFWDAEANLDNQALQYQ